VLPLGVSRRAACAAAALVAVLMLMTADLAHGAPVVGAFKVSADSKTVRYHGKATLLVRSLDVRDVRHIRIRLYCDGCRRFAGRARKERLSGTRVRFSGLNWLLTSKRTMLITGLRKGHVTRYLRMGADRRHRLVFRAAGCMDSRRVARTCPQGTSNPTSGSAVPSPAGSSTPAPQSSPDPTPTRAPTGTTTPVPPPIARGLPETLLVAGPGSAVAAHATKILFASGDPDATFQCSLDGGAYVPCASPVSLSGLVEGPHAFLVRAETSDGQDATPLKLSFSVDTIAPETTITSGPGADPNWARFTFTSDENGSFDCSLDNATNNWAPCFGEKSYEFAGTHTFYVRARDYAGNVDPTPAMLAWTR
jgi:hypothetical protein